MKDEFKPAIAALQNKLAELERAAAETKRSINQLCALAEAPPLYVNIDSESKPSITSLRSDQFYGKVLNTAAREYLDIRKSGNLGPATPREIYEALIGGGFKFDTKSEVNAITALRQVLRKNSSIFHRLPQGDYGLLSWYPNAKAAKQDDDDDDAAPARKNQRQPRRKAKAHKDADKGQRAKADKTSEPHAADDKGASLAPVVLASLTEDSDLTVADLKIKVLAMKLPGITEATVGRKLQGTLLALARKGIVVSGDKGAWRKAKQKAAA